MHTHTHTELRVHLGKAGSCWSPCLTWKNRKEQPLRLYNSAALLDDGYGSWGRAERGTAWIRAPGSANGEWTVCSCRRGNICNLKIARSRARADSRRLKGSSIGSLCSLLCFLLYIVDSRSRIHSCVYTFFFYFLLTALDRFRQSGYNLGKFADDRLFDLSI